MSLVLTFHFLNVSNLLELLTFALSLTFFYWYWHRICASDVFGWSNNLQYPCTKCRNSCLSLSQERSTLPVWNWFSEFLLEIFTFCLPTLSHSHWAFKVIFCAESGGRKTAIPVTSLKVGDEIMLRLQGGARHTGIEIQEFIVEK